MAATTADTASLRSLTGVVEEVVSVNQQELFKASVAQVATDKAGQSAHIVVLSVSRTCGLG